MPREIRWLYRHARPFLPLLTANLTCMLLGSGLSLLDPLIVRWLIDNAIPRRNLHLVLLGTFLFCVIYLSSVAVNYASAFLSSVISQRMVFRIRVSSLRHVQSLPAQYHANAKVGDTLYRLEQDVDRVAELSGDILPLTLQMAILGVMVLVTMGCLNWRLTIIVIPLLPVFYLLQRKYSTRLKRAADKVQNQSGKLSGFLQEHLVGMLQLQLLNRTGTQTRKFARIAADAARYQIHQRATEMSFGIGSVSIIVLGMGLILGYGGFEVTRNALTVGGLVAFYGYIFRLFAPVSIAIDLQSRLQRVSASIRRIIELADGTPSIKISANRLPAKFDAMCGLEFKAVRFGYEDCRPVLRDMSFQIATGETVAIVGMNGSGKSTIGLLATRLYEPESGSILLGGRDIREISPRILRSIVTLVPQDPILFDETIRGNLLYGNPQATNKDLHIVAALAQLNEVLQRVPGGFDEPLGPLGNRLSGGEKKRLALARSFLQKPNLLILDEITSTLDEPAAESILHGLDLFRRACTLIIISHRPATILWADRILVVGEGAAVDTGKHDELIRRCSLYQRIWKTQENLYSRIAHKELYNPCR
jgi:ABC-type multidrug transport system fused ATPase/permease subunit